MSDDYIVQELNELKHQITDMQSKLSDIEKEMVERDANAMFKIYDEMEDFISKHQVSCSALSHIDNVSKRIDIIDNIWRKIQLTTIGIIIATILAFFFATIGKIGHWLSNMFLK